ncbi:MAG: hypothetical protein ABMA64_42065 [Myxococcota bacterium]
MDDGGTCRPVQLDDISTIITGEGICMPGATFSLDGQLVAAASCYDAGQVLIARSADNHTFSAPEPIDAVASDSTGATVDGRSYLYFVSWPGGLTRAEVTLTGLGPSESLTLVGASTVPYWPQAVGTEWGVLLGFVESQTSASLATSEDGVSFAVEPAPIGTDNLRGVLLHVGQTAGGRSVLAHQNADASWSFTSRVQLGGDGASWSEPIVVDDGNVHDTFPVARLDAGADLYFLKAGPTQELNVFRRSLGEDGALGPVQSVTAPVVGHVEKPQARRLADGRLALMFAMRKATYQYGIGLAILDHDAPTD